MPLTPATTDKFQKVGLPGSATTLAAPGYTIGNASVSVGSTTNHPTDTLYTFAIDRAQTVNGVTSRIPGTYCEFEGIVSGGSTIANMTLKYGTAQNYPSGSFTRVYIPVSSNRENALIDGLNVDHNGKGNHKTLTDDNGNAWLTRAQVVAAVNSIMAANAATGGAPRFDATGSDTTIPLYFGGKGGEPAHAENPELFINFIASGGVIAQSSGLIGTFSNMVFYSTAKRYKKTSVANKTYTASKDTYVDADPTSNGTVTYTEVANGAASPALTAGYVRVGKVVTSASAITLIQQYAADSLNNLVYPSAPIGNAKLNILSAIPMFTDNSTSGNFTSAIVVNTNIVVPAGCNRILILGKLRVQAQTASATDMSASIIYDNGVSATPSNPGQQTSPTPSVVTGVGTFSGGMDPFMDVFNTTPGTHNIQVSVSSNNTMNCAYKQLIFIPLAG